jgi:hypothetical protein
MRMFHSLLIIWHSQAADFKFHRSVNTHALSKSPVVRASSVVPVGQADAAVASGNESLFVCELHDSSSLTD